MPSELDEQVTILIPTSPIPRHPSTDLIEECVDGVRAYFPDAQLIIMSDGVRPQVEHRRAQYEEYKRNLACLVGSKFGRSWQVVFDEHSQQAVMTREVLRRMVTTPLILFVEHDAILRREPPINFQAIIDLLLSEQVNLVRFYNWQDIWHEHQHLMHGEITYGGSRFVKTTQYSQWPLVSSTEYHRRILHQHFGSNQKSMIEPVMYGPVVAAPWTMNKIVIYLDAERTFTHRDGRTDERSGIRDPAGW